MVRESREYRDFRDSREQFLDEFEVVLTNLQSLDFGLKGGGWDSKLGRRTTRSRDTASGFSQGGLNDFLFSMRLTARGLRCL